MKVCKMAFEIFYLDDEQDLCENFKDYFSSNEFNITTFTVPEMAIEAVKKTPPDLIFIDYRLPGMNGDQVALFMDKEIPKYLITGDHLLTTQYGFVGTVSKPYRAHEIQSILDVELENKK